MKYVFQTLICKAISLFSFRKSCTIFINLLCASPPCLLPAWSNLSVLLTLSTHSQHIQTMSVWLLWLFLQNICSVNKISLIIGVTDHSNECAVFEHGEEAKTTETRAVCFWQMWFN